MLRNSLNEGGCESRLIDQVREAIRARHYTCPTEEAYVDWARTSGVRLRTYYGIGDDMRRKTKVYRGTAFLLSKCYVLMLQANHSYMQVVTGDSRKRIMRMKNILR